MRLILHPRDRARRSAEIDMFAPVVRQGKTLRRPARLRKMRRFDDSTDAGLGSSFIVRLTALRDARHRQPASRFRPSFGRAPPSPHHICIHPCQRPGSGGGPIAPQPPAVAPSRASRHSPWIPPSMPDSRRVLSRTETEWLLAFVLVELSSIPRRSARRAGQTQCAAPGRKAAGGRQALPSPGWCR